MKKFLLLTFIFLPNTLFAYIPHADFIIEQVAKKHGNGHYEIKLEVTLQKGDRQSLVHETWSIDSGDRLRLIARSDDFYLERLYIGDNYYFKNPNGKTMKAKVSDEFLETWFLERSKSRLRKDILKTQLATREALRWDPTKVKDSAATEKPIRLSRSRGIITYALGVPTPVGQTQLNPGIWIEQDKFVIRKIRFPTLSEVTADEYGDYSKGMLFPKTRLVSWGAQTVPIRVVSVNWKSGKSRVSFESFQKTAKPSKSQESYLSDFVAEFYGKFR